MFRTIDPLDYLRVNIQKNKEIKRVEDSLIFEDGIKLKLDTPTALLQPQSKNNKHYTLGSLWLFLKYRNEKLADYMKEAQSQQVDLVIGIDKDKIIDFFINSIDDVEILDNEIRPKTLISLGKKKKGDNFDELFGKSGENKNISKYVIKKDKHREEELKNPHLAIMDYIYTNEKKSLNRNSIMKPKENILSFENLLSLSKKIFTKEGGLSERTEKQSFLDELLENSDGLGFTNLIIVVPPSFAEGNLCLRNAKAFLNNGKYVNVDKCSEDEKELLVDENNEGENIFGYKIKDKENKEKKLIFEICSNVRKFSKNDWKRVVAVFVQGEDWEFKDWPKSENVSTILQKVKGFYLKYSDTPLNNNIKKWNVKILEISRTKRYCDISIQNDFWNSLRDFLLLPRKR